MVLCHPGLSCSDAVELGGVFGSSVVTLVMSVLVRGLLWVPLTEKCCLVVNQTHNAKLVGDC